MSLTIMGNNFIGVFGFKLLECNLKIQLQFIVSQQKKVDIFFHGEQNSPENPG